jgi:excisionase family DNA binding protein
MLHTPADIAEKLNVSRMTVYRLIQTRAIASLRIGRHFRVSPFSNSKEHKAMLQLQSKTEPRLILASYSKNEDEL